MARKLKNKVVVITGASSGIGRAAARAFAREGATVVVAARREGPLREVEEECARTAGRALAVPTDVTDGDQVRMLAQRAVESFGGIDIWVNNAGVTVLSRFEDAPPDVYEHVIRTNLFGYIHGARAVLPYFREQGHGVLINNASMVAYMGQPYASAYVISKFGVRALSECLRQELLDAPGIKVCTLMPAMIDTPFFQHAANYTGRKVRAVPPVFPPERVAETVLRLARRPRREVFVGWPGPVLAAQHAMAPGLTERMMARMTERVHLGDASAAPGPGNVLEPMAQGTAVNGGWRQAGSKGGGMLAGLLLIGLPLGVYAWQRRRRPPSIQAESGRINSPAVPRAHGWG